MWNIKNKNSTDITMTEGDYGMEMSIAIEGVSISTSDTITITIKKERNGREILTKDFTINEDNTIDLVWTEAESDELKVGTYLYALDWYRNGVFMCNIVNGAKLKVEDKI